MHNDIDIKNINDKLNQILKIQESFNEHKEKQNLLNKDIIHEIKMLESRISQSEQNIQLVFETLKIDSERYSNILNGLSDIKTQQETLNERLNSSKDVFNEKIKNNNDKTNSHSKIFFTMLGLNFTLLGAIVIQFIKKIME